MSELAVTDSLVGTLLDEIRRHGGRTNETGGFIGGSSLDAPADLLVLAGERGIRRRRDLFQVSGPAVGCLFDWASERGVSLRAQFHSHRRKAFLSPVDLEYGFAVDGFVSSVVPAYADPPAPPADWGWWRFRANAWLPIDAPEVVAGDAEVVYFDEDGIRGI